MKPDLTLVFSRDATPDLMHRALNFVEDVSRELERGGIGAVSESGRFGDGRFFVTLGSRRFLGDAQLLVGRLVRQHMLSGAVVVSRGSTSSRSAERGAV